ncbi:MAG: hypothetical protein LUQ02_03180 [Methanothrix sp.]|nr:hypothetical protein [Methanothrix sp.]OYV12587.1 MAG: hypothetical protein CG445_645 [Methanosaeta sp. ASM2]
MEIKYAIAVAPVLTLLAACQAQNTYIPYELGGDNCDTMYGSPDISASVSGTDEFERGDTVMLYVDLTNYGKISGFKEDQTPQNPKEFALANSELGKMQKKAWGIVTFFFREPKDPSDSNIELERYG